MALEGTGVVMGQTMEYFLEAMKKKIESGEKVADFAKDIMDRKKGGIGSMLDKMPGLKKTIAIVKLTAALVSFANSEVKAPDIGTLKGTHGSFIAQQATKMKESATGVKMAVENVESNPVNFLREVSQNVEGIKKQISKGDKNFDFNKCYSYRIVINNIFNVGSERYMQLVSAMSKSENGDTNNKGKIVEEFHKQLAEICGVNDIGINDLTEIDELSLSTEDNGIATEINNTYLISEVKKLQETCKDKGQLRYMEKLLQGRDPNLVDPESGEDPIYEEAKKNFNLSFLELLNPFMKITQHSGSLVDRSGDELGNERSPEWIAAEKNWEGQVGDLKSVLLGEETQDEKRKNARAKVTEAVEEQESAEKIAAREAEDEKKIANLLAANAVFKS